MVSQAYQLRPATVDDARSLTNLAFMSKAHWGYAQNWLDLWRDELTFTPEFIREQDVELLECRAQIVAVYALSLVGQESELEALWVHPDHMGRGLGSWLFGRAADKARERGAHNLVIISDPHAEAFYIAMGCRRIGDIPSQPEGRRLPKLAYPLR